MNYLSMLWLSLFFLLCLSCKKEKETEVKLLNADDFWGRWSSVDSMRTYLSDDSGFYEVFLKDTICFTKYHLVGNDTLYKNILTTERAVYLFEILPKKKLKLDFFQYNTRDGGFVNRTVRKEIDVHFSENKDTITLKEISLTYPYTRFDRFYKLIE